VSEISSDMSASNFKYFRKLSTVIKSLTVLQPISTPNGLLLLRSSADIVSNKGGCWVQNQFKIF
jgi:hypothetical protein